MINDSIINNLIKNSINFYIILFYYFNIYQLYFYFQKIKNK
jgi:hypothetical protein